MGNRLYQNDDKILCNLIIGEVGPACRQAGSGLFQIGGVG